VLSFRSRVYCFYIIAFIQIRLSQFLCGVGD
jgi:hypothetical protein